MKILVRTLASLLIAAFGFAAQAADGIAFITNLRGEVAVDGSARPVLMSELAKGQKIVVGKDSQLSVMYIQSGKEYLLKGPADFAVGEREITSATGMPPAARETAWRANNQVLVKVAQTSSASIRMRSVATPAKTDDKPKLVFPTRGAVASLQPTFRWHAADAKAPAEITVAMSGKEDKPALKAKVAANSLRAPANLQADTEYTWTVSSGGHALGTAKFRTLPGDAIQAIDKRRPSERAEFSDRVLFALLLLEHGAQQEAQEVWGRLAQERSDLPELAGLAK
jgi:hypothetical protein